MDQFNIHLYKDVWVLASSVEIAGGGIYLDAPPVRVIPYDDRDNLKTVLFELLAEDAPVVPRAVLYEEQDPLGIKPRAVNAKSALAYLKQTRCFDLQRTEDYLSIEEWTKDRGSWHAEPLWKKKFGPDEMDKLIDFLIKKTKKKI